MSTVQPELRDTPCASLTGELSRTRYASLWVCSGLLVTLVRLFYATDPGYDLTIQLQAAQHLLLGKGLSIYADTAGDLADPLKLIPLTHFSCGYSLCAAALTLLGLQTGAIIKILGATATVAGWWGWGRLAYDYAAEALQFGRLWRWTAVIVAIVTPVFFTIPWWQGTDIFLWAAVPWVLGWLVQGAGDSALPGGSRFDAMAGALCGFAVLMRYASVCLAGYALLVILCQAGWRFSSLLRRWTVFGCVMLAVILPQIYINFMLPRPSPMAPGGVNLELALRAPTARFLEGFHSITSANIMAVFWAPTRVAELLTQNLLRHTWLLGVTVLLLAFPILLARRLRPSFASAVRDLKVVAAGFMLVIPLFLWACMLMGSYDYVKDHRYYLPAVPLCLLLAIHLAVPRTTASQWLALAERLFSGGYLVAYLVWMMVTCALLFAPGGRGGSHRAQLLGTASVRPWPSMGLVYDHSIAREFVLARVAEDPNSILLTNQEQEFYAEPRMDRSRIHRILAWHHWKSASGPLRILIYVSDLGGQPDELFLSRADIPLLRDDFLTQLPDLRVVKRFPAEQRKLLEARIPAGQWISFPKRRVPVN